jgi:hypothetical protein
LLVKKLFSGRLRRSFEVTWSRWCFRGWPGWGLSRGLSWYIYIDIICTCIYTCTEHIYIYHIHIWTYIHIYIHIYTYYIHIIYYLRSIDKICYFMILFIVILAKQWHSKGLRSARAGRRPRTRRRWPEDVGWAAVQKDSHQ